MTKTIDYDELQGFPTVFIVCGEYVTCPCCGELSNTVSRRRRNTQYCQMLDECNWLEACEVCMEQDDEYNADRWEEYYNMVY
jgi:hypothetical protein